MCHIHGRGGHYHAEEVIIVPRRSRVQIVRPHQWHVTKGGHIVEKKFWEGG